MIFVFLILSSISLVSGKIYKRCELAKELKNVHNAPVHQLATWVCIAEHESQYKTDAVGHMGEKGTADHGIFQINDKYWCSPPGQGRACGLTCSKLEDDDITDDFKCAQKIYKEHKILSGDGFNAWAVYQPHCKGSKSAKYLKDCFGEGNNSSNPAGIPFRPRPYSFQFSGEKEIKKNSPIFNGNVFGTHSAGSSQTKNPAHSIPSTTETLKQSTFKLPKPTTIKPNSPSLKLRSEVITNSPRFGVQTKTLTAQSPTVKVNTYIPINRYNKVNVLTNKLSSSTNLKNKNYVTSSSESLQELQSQTPSKLPLLSQSVSKNLMTERPVFIINNRPWY